MGETADSGAGAAANRQSATGSEGPDGATAGDGNGTDGNGSSSDNGRDAGAPDRGSDEMAWNFSRTAAGPKLVYGEPQTDNVRLLLRCAGNQVSLNFMRPADVVATRPERLVIASAGEQRTTNVSTEDTQLGPISVSATAPIASAPISAFRSGNPLEVRWGDETIRVPGTNQAEQFFAACG